MDGEVAERSQLTTHCVCYVTDAGYLFPTLLSAIQARKHLNKERADVLVFTVDVGPGVLEDFKRLAADGEIRLIEVPASALAVMAGMHTRSEAQFKKKVPVSAMGRLMLADVLPQQYSEFLYLDGDTQVNGALDALMHFEVPEGKFLAARDYMAVMGRFMLPWRPWTDAHHDRLGLSPVERARYFNSGVIRANRKTWSRVGAAALAFFMEFPERCEPFHDQGALNGVGHPDLILMSQRWNLPRHFLRLGLSESEQPVIVHYMSNPKPWHGAFLPWSRREFRPYAEMARRYPEVARYMPRLSRIYWLGYKLKTTRNYLAERFGRPTRDEIVGALNDRVFPI